jgi:hypothetical protein
MESVEKKLCKGLAGLEELRELEEKHEKQQDLRESDAICHVSHG